MQKAFRRHHHSHYYNKNLLQDLCSKYYDQNAQVRPAEVSEQRSVAAVPVQRANADTAGLIDDFQSARISLEELN